MRRRNAGSAKRPVRSNKRKVGKRRAAPALAADPQQQIEALTRELKDERDQRKAASDLLNVISHSGVDLHTVLDTLVESATRLCNADYAWVFELKDNVFQWLASFGHATEQHARIKKYYETHVVSVDRGSAVGRAALEGRVIHISDVLSDPEYTYGEAQKIGGYRSVLGVPLPGKGGVIGAIFVAKVVPQPFTDKQIELVTNFAAQAVIAIENARLLNELHQRTNDLSESLEQQTATSEVLRVISSSPGELEPVFQVMLTNATRICEAKFGILFLFEPGGQFRAAAMHGVPPVFAEYWQRGPRLPGPRTPLGRVAASKRAVHMVDVKADPAYVDGEQILIAAVELGGFRTFVNVPMLKDDDLIGVFAIYRQEVRPFTAKQIEVLQNFAAQAVIAIENARLLNELRQRTDDLTESLDQQTATSEVLQVISGSPGELEPVFETMLENAKHICDAKFVALYLAEEDGIRLVAAQDLPPALAEAHAQASFDPAPDGALGGVIETKQTVHLADLSATRSYTERHPVTVKGVEDAGIRTLLAVPLLKDDKLIGILATYRQEVRPFTEKQVALLTNFAAQAVIAIENTRLLNELRESLEQQTATSEVLKVISSSPANIQPVLEIIGERAEKLCDAEISVVSVVEGELIRLASFHGLAKEIQRAFPMQFTDETVTARAVRTRSVCHVADVLDDPQYQEKDVARITGFRGCLGVPMVREEEVVGAIFVARKQPGLFSDAQVQLLKTFADQAVIAVENVRLFNETKNSLEQQTATADVLKVISRSTFDLQTVLDTLVESAGRLCEADHAWLFRREGELFHFAASFGLSAEEHTRIRTYLQTREVRAERGSVTGRCALEGKVIHVADVLADPEYTWHGAQKLGGYRAGLGAPLLREGNVIGVIFLMKKVAQPFTEKQIELVTTFADQAVIAIENARLLTELRQSLQQQTATADVLKVISRSAFDLLTVLDALLKSAAHLCDADQGTITQRKGDIFFRTVSYSFPPEFLDYVKDVPVEPSRETGTGRALAEGKIIHIPDVLADPDYTWTEAQRRGGFRTLLGVPMLRDGTSVGVLTLTRTAVRPFTDKQIELVSTFADQAAIAIENVRLFEAEQQRTRELANSLEELRTAQDRLVQTQKLASLGQLTAGIAHEIKNPLNFVNNFSGVSAELVDELSEALLRVAADENTRAEFTELMATLRGNLNKIVQHGKRADSIVKNMLLHSREGSGEHRPVDINAVLEESLNLAYHGARAEKQGFNITLERSFDPAAGEVDLFPQEITRVFLNLISNGFYAATKRKAQSNDQSYEPVLTAATKNLGDRVEVRIRDNGTGIPPEVRERIFNPFFTTKPAGEGTGLGLSLSHDIVVKQHAGVIEVESQPGGFTEFRIVLPRTAAGFAKPGGQA